MNIFLRFIQRVFHRSTPSRVRPDQFEPERLDRPRPQEDPSGIRETPQLTFTQFGDGGAAQPLDVVLGLDFGTSCVKAVVQAPGMQGRRSTAIDFGPLGHPRCRHLLPTALADLEGGRVALKVHDSESVRADDLKVALMSPECPALAKARATAFLALAIREARAYFLRARRADYGHLALRWSMNVGIPSAGYDDAEIRDRFRQIADATWKFSLSRGNPSVPQIATLLNGLGVELAPRDQCEIQVVPEIAAEVVGYAKSSRRRSGLHLMVDVGASTLDVCSFVLHAEAGDDSYNLLTACVERYGVRALAEARQAHGDSHTPVRAMDPAPLSPGEQIKPEPTEAHCAEHIDMCRRIVMRVLVDARTRRDPKSDRWGKEIPVFHCGGGSLLKEYQAVLSGASERLEEFYSTRLRVTRLDTPKDLFSERPIDASLFKRLAVAHGLSHDSFDIGDVRPPSEIGDVPKRGCIDHSERYVSKEMV